MANLCVIWFGIAADTALLQQLRHLNASTTATTSVLSQLTNTHSTDNAFYFVFGSEISIAGAKKLMGSTPAFCKEPFARAKCSVLEMTAVQNAFSANFLVC